MCAADAEFVTRVPVKVETEIAERMGKIANADGNLKVGEEIEIDEIFFEKF